jgi:hypothetical protein
MLHCGGNYPDLSEAWPAACDSIPASYEYYCFFPVYTGGMMLI